MGSWLILIIILLLTIGRLHVRCSIRLIRNNWLMWLIILLFIFRRLLPFLLLYFTEQKLRRGLFLDFSWFSALDSDQVMMINPYATSLCISMMSFFSMSMCCKSFPRRTVTGRLGATATLAFFLHGPLCNSTFSVGYKHVSACMHACVTLGPLALNPA